MLPDIYISIRKRKKKPPVRQKARRRPRVLTKLLPSRLRRAVFETHSPREKTVRKGKERKRKVHWDSAMI
jgi:hypothetical protein